jgi:hypothetical protein
MLSKSDLIHTLKIGRIESYVKKTPEYNPYEKSELYDWHFEFKISDLIYTDSYRGFNPYSGVEYIYEINNQIPVWSCDYVGYVNQNDDVSTAKVYDFLKESRRNHLTDPHNDYLFGYHYKNGLFRYETSFHGESDALLQIEKFYYKEQLIAQQISAGRLK